MLSMTRTLLLEPFHQPISLLTQVLLHIDHLTLDCAVLLGGQAVTLSFYPFSPFLLFA